MSETIALFECFRDSDAAVGGAIPAILSIGSGCCNPGRCRPLVDAESTAGVVSAFFEPGLANAREASGSSNAPERIDARVLPRRGHLTTPHPGQPASRLSCHEANVVPPCMARSASSSVPRDRRSTGSNKRKVRNAGKETTWKAHGWIARPVWSCLGLDVVGNINRAEQSEKWRADGLASRCSNTLPVKIPTTHSLTHSPTQTHDGRPFLIRAGQTKHSRACRCHRLHALPHRELLVRARAGRIELGDVLAPDFIGLSSQRQPRSGASAAWACSSRSKL